MHSCHNFPAVSRQAARGTCICETSLFICDIENQFKQSFVFRDSDLYKLGLMEEEDSDESPADDDTEKGEKSMVDEVYG